MAELDIAQTTTPTKIIDLTIESQDTDGVQDQNETFYDNLEFTKWYGMFMSTNKLKASIKSWATWVMGLGTVGEDSATDIINGWGKDTWEEILWNMLVIKKVNGDAYAEIIRNPDTGTLINVKPLNPGTIRIVINKEGIIERYEQRLRSKEPNRIINVENMFHLSNDRVADEIHGDSIMESLIWNIEAQEEARRMYRKKVKNSGIIGIVEADTDNTTKLTSLKAPIKKGVEEGMFLIDSKLIWLNFLRLFYN